MIGYTHLLLEENPKKGQVDKLKSLKFSADNLLSLVNDILDHSKIESGKIVFANDRFDLGDRLIGLREVMDIKAHRKGLELKLNIDDRLPQFVKGDPVRLNQILLNLVSNAIKFTEKGRVEILARMLGQTREHIEVQFSVKDTGIGIPEAKQRRIFDTFVQADSSILNNYGGTGLGLSITKNLVELQGGNIQVKSLEGQGSTFSFTLSFGIDAPLQVEEASPEQVVAKPVIEASIKGARVLLVEDNPINQKIATQFLNKWGASVEVANHGKEGLELIADKKFDFVLMDIQMPEMDGYETTRAIRAIEDDYFRNIPIISLTADAFTEVRDRVLEAGMNDYVTKPINPEQFLKTIAKYYKPRT